MSDYDRILLDTYMWGYNDELDDKIRMWNPNPLLIKAYNLGRIDAKAGDDVKSIDQQTNDEILNRIYDSDDDVNGSNSFHLEYCSECIQMTNHIKNKCQKCKAKLNK